MNIIDFIALAIIILMVIKGLKKGLVLTVFEMASFFVAAFCAAVYHPYVSKMLMGTKVFEWVQQTVSKCVANVNPPVVQAVGPADSINTANTIMDSLQLPDFLQKFLVQKGKTDFNQILGLDNLMETISTSVSTFIVTILAMVLIFFAVKIILHIVSHILNGIMKLPLLNTANRLSGAIFGVINGAFIIYILCAVLALFAPMQMFAPIVKLINESSIGRVFYNNNILLQIIF